MRAYGRRCISKLRLISTLASRSMFLQAISVTTITSRHLKIHFTCISNASDKIYLSSTTASQHPSLNAQNFHGGWLAQWAVYIEPIARLTIDLKITMYGTFCITRKVSPGRGATERISGCPLSDYIARHNSTKQNCFVESSVWIVGGLGVGRV